MESLALELLYPLNEWYQAAGRAVPQAEPVDPRDVPPVERRLLVHRRDMTQTLEQAHGQRIHIEFLGRDYRENWIERHVLLVLQDGSPVELGSIKIYLDRFPAPVREILRDTNRPLGSVLNTEGVAYRSRPSAYFRIATDDAIREALRAPGASFLYGRRNVLLNPAGEPLADVVEILPPSELFPYLEANCE